MTKLTDIDGISATSAKKLAKAGITTAESLLESANTAKRRQTLAEATSIKEETIATWVNRADLYRVKGVAAKAVTTLEKAGVTTLSDLAKSKPAQLAAAIQESQSKSRKKSPSSVPSEKVVEKWVAEAKALPKVVRK